MKKNCCYKYLINESTVNLSNRKKKFPIHIASQNGYDEAVIELIINGSDIEALDKVFSDFIKFFIEVS